MAIRRTESKLDVKKQWISPELKKVSIEQITAHKTYATTADGSTVTTSHTS
jgi:hypothetical protein